MRRTKFAFLAVVCLLLAGSTFGRQLPNIDKLGEAAPSPAKAQLVQQRAARLQQKGSTLSTESRLGVPTFFWPNKAAVAAEIPGLKPGTTTVASHQPSRISDIASGPRRVCWSGRARSGRSHSVW